MALMYGVLGMSAEMPLEEGKRLALQEIKHALELDPHLADAYMVRAILKGSLYFDFSGARKDLEHANRLLPNNSDIYRALSYNSVAFGEFEQSMAQARKAISLDPLNPRMFSLEGRVLFYQGKYEQALKIFMSRLQVTPNSQGILLNVGYSQLALGMYPEALETAAKVEDGAYNPQLLTMAYHGLGKSEESEQELQRLINDSAHDSAYQIAEVYCFRNELEKCFEWIDTSFKQLDPGLQNLSTSPFLKSSHTDPRYEMYLDKLNQPTSF
jgi:tetratricopeptide (TPR) repeat protein